MKNYSSRLSQLWYGLLMLFAFSIPFSIKLNSILLIITAACSCVYYVTCGEKENLKNNKLLLFAVLYFLCAIGILNSHNVKPAFFDFEQKVSLLILPLIFAAGPSLNNHKKRYLQSAFVIGTLIICLLNFRNGFYWGYSATEEMYETNLLIGRPYLGMYCVFCIFFCLESIMEDQRSWVKLVSFLLISFFCFFLAALFAKMAFIGLLVLGFIYILFQLVIRKNFFSVGTILATIFFMLTYAILFNSKGKEIAEKLLTFSEFDWVNYDATLVNSVNLRFIKWQCTVNVLAENHNWLWGAGTGDSQQLLDTCYANRLGANSFFVTGHFNSHNQYFTTWLNLGLISLVFLLFHFMCFIYYYWKERNWIGLIFTVGIMLFSTTESIFEAQKGIVIYSFFQSLFFFSKPKSDSLTE